MIVSLLLMDKVRRFLRFQLKINVFYAGFFAGPDHIMHMARLLIDSGHWNQGDFSALFSDRTPPPTSKKFLDNLKDHLVRGEGEIQLGDFHGFFFSFPDISDEGQCPICLKSCEQDDVVNELPCNHKFHKECILPWLNKVGL